MSADTEADGERGADEDVMLDLSRRLADRGFYVLGLVPSSRSRPREDGGGGTPVRPKYFVSPTERSS